MKKGLILVVSVVLVLGAAVFWFLHKGYRQLEDILLSEGLTMLEERLGTQVIADSVGVDLKRGELGFYGISVNDLNDSALLRIDTLAAQMSIRKLLDHQVLVNRVCLYGGKVRIYRTAKDSLPNIQFLFQALKKKPKADPNKKDHCLYQTY